MRKLLFLIVSSIVFVGCNGASMLDENTLPILAGITSREIGCAVANTGDVELDRTLRNIYTTIKSGEIPEDAIKQLEQLSEEHIGDHPTLVANVLDLVRLFGIKIDEDTLEKVHVTPEVLQNVADGYLGGFDTCQKE